MTGCAAPAWAGNGTNIHMEGAIGSEDLYITHGWDWGNPGWHGYCNQEITNAAGRRIGWYVDDSVNYYPGPPRSQWPGPRAASGEPWANEANCVWWDHETYPRALIIAAIAPNRTYSFAPWGALDAQERYPVCGNRLGSGAPPIRSGYIAQWNFVWPNCGPSSRALIDSALSQIARDKPTLILFY